MTMQSPVQPPAMSTERRRTQQSDRSQQIDLFDGVADADAGMAGPAGGDAGYADWPDGAADPGARSDLQPGLTDGGRS